MNKVKTNHLKLLCQYIADKRSGEMVQTRGYTEDYLSFGSISQSDLDTLCHIANGYILNDDEFAGNSMGELMIVKRRGHG